MSLPDAVGKPSLTGEATAPGQNGGAVPSPPVGRIQIALAPRAGLQPAEEIQRLLRKRLRFFALLISGGLSVLLLVVLLPILMADRNAPGSVATFGVYCGVWAVAAVAGWLLCTTRALSLSQLRKIELIVFGTLAASGIWMHYDLFVKFWPWRVPDLAGDMGYPLLLASGESLPWVFLIVVYGTFIPNTWRRCAAFVGMTAAIPLALGAVSGIADGAMASRALLDFLTLMGVWLAFGAAVAVYGSYRIELLRQEALEARKLGQYQLKRRLGSGGMGEVYLAEHLLLRRPCAVKVIRPERAGDARDLARFEREVQATATLTHPNTVQIFDYGHAEDGTFYYAMEYLPGLSLSELVQRHGPLPPERAVHFLRQVCGALSEAHGIGLIHRDIKPSNIMVCPRGGLHDVAKLLDFGLVRAPVFGDAVGALTQDGTIIGTPIYMSPEQAAGRDDLDARSDIYSLGAVAYYVLTGQPPFAHRSPTEVLAAHLYESPEPLARHRIDVSGELDAVILKCLAKEPNQRFPDAAGLEKALAACPTAESWTQERAAAWWQGRATSTDN